METKLNLPEMSTTAEYFLGMNAGSSHGQATDDVKDNRLEHDVRVAILEEKAGSLENIAITC